MTFDGQTYSAGLCPLVQQKLLDLSLQYHPQFTRDSLGYLNAITSDFNKQATGMVANQVPGTGNYRAVQVVYKQRSTTANVVSGTNAQPECVDSGTDTGPLEDIVNITQWTGTTLAFSEDNMQKLCEPGMNYIMDSIQGAFNSIFTVIDQAILVTQAANMGKFYDGTITKNIPLISPLTLGVDPSSYSSLMLQNRLIGYQGPVMAIGDIDLITYADLSNYGCCSWAGVDISTMAPGRFLPFLDPNVTSPFGAGHFITLVPGTVQLLTFNRYKDPAKQLISGMSSTGTIVDPVTGIEVDMRIFFDPRCSQWFIEIGLWYELFTLPADIFDATDTQNGVRGTLEWVIV